MNRHWRCRMRTTSLTQNERRDVSTAMFSLATTSCPDKSNPLCLSRKAIINLVDSTTGLVSGDSWGEHDTRFSYIAISTLSLLGRLGDLDAAFDGRGRELVVGHIERCKNFDGGFGSEEGAESHG